MRADVLALTPDALAALTNRGLVKRATRRSLMMRRLWETWNTSTLTGRSRRLVKARRSARLAGLAVTRPKPSSPVQSPDAVPAVAALGQLSRRTL